MNIVKKRPSMWVKRTALFAGALFFMLGVMMGLPGGTHATPTPDESVTSFAELQTAIANANSAGGSYVIEVKNDIICATPLTISGETTIYGSTGGEELSIASGRHFSLTAGASLTLLDITLDGDTTGGGVVVNGATLILDDAVIQNCYMSGYGGGVYATNNSTVTVENNSAVMRNISTVNGGGIYAENSDVTVSGSVFLGNEAQGTTQYQGLGGGICLYVTGSYDGSITVTADSSFENNRARVGGGVASFNYNAVTSANVGGDKSPVTIADSEFIDNKADWNGGGVYSSTGDVEATDCYFEGNTAAYGAGLCVAVKTAASASSGGNQYNTVTIIGTDFVGNIASGSSGYGGGVYTNTYGDVNIDGCLFNQNWADSYGGGLASYSPLTIMDTEFINNTADQMSGGGVYVNSWNEQITLSGCTLTGNSAGQNGGGLSLSYCYLSIIDCELEGNTASTGDGGALWASLFSDCTIQNSRITDNTADVDGGGILLTGGYALILSDDTAIEKNEATTGNGGGICAYNSAVTVSDSTIHQNTAALNGGGIYIIGEAITAIDATFTENSADNGGAVYLPSDRYARGTLSASGDSVFMDNIAATDGGAIYTDISNYTGIVTAATTVFDGNQSIQAYLPPHRCRYAVSRDSVQPGFHLEPSAQ